jgi:iron complex outermembrane recepter protein
MEKGLNQSTCLLAVAAVLASGLLLPQAASAQDASDVTDQGIEEIIVTAQKRSESIQDVPLSITAVDGESLAERGVTNAVDFAKEIPNIQIKTGFAATNPTIFMRGIGINDFSPASAGAIGVLVDEVFLNSTTGQLVQIYDLDRVEVLKGPQGTLYGRNTTGGVINFFTKKPGFDFDPSLQLTYGRYNEFNVEAASSIPIVDDKIAARVSVSLKRRDGYRRNLFNGERLNDVDQTAGRIQLLFQPTERLEILAKFEAGFNRSTFYTTEGLGIIDPATGGACTPQQILQRDVCSNFLGYIESRDTRVANSNYADQKEDLDSYTGRVGINWDGDSVALTSISSYVSNEAIIRQDIDGSPFRVLEQPFGRGYARQFTQEVRLASTSNDAFKWLVGGFYLTEKLDSFSAFEAFAEFNPTPGVPYLDLTGATTGGIPVFRVDKFYRQNTRSFALFGQASYELTDRLKVTVGARYSWDRKDINLRSVFGPVDPTLQRNPIVNPICCLVGDIASIDPAIGLPTAPIIERRSYKKPIWRFAIDYRPNDDVLLYGSYSRGVRSGGFNAGATTDPLEFSIVSPEKIDAFELGLKSDLLDRKLRFNAAAFYYSGQLQVFTLRTGVVLPIQVLDSAEVEGYGLEADLQARPMDGLDLKLSGAVFRGKYTDYPGTPSNIGNRLSNAPRASLAASARYETAVSGSLRAAIGADVTYQSKIFFQPSNQAVQAQDGYAIVNGRLSLLKESPDLELSFWVKNVFDKVYLADIFDVTSFGNYQANYSTPRTFGVSLSARF